MHWGDFSVNENQLNFQKLNSKEMQTFVVSYEKGFIFYFHTQQLMLYHCHHSNDHIF